MTTYKKNHQYGTGIVARIAAAIGKPYRGWALENGFSDLVAVNALRSWVAGKTINGYKSNRVLRTLLSQLGHPIPPDQELPPPKILKDILKKRRIYGSK